MTRCLGLRWQVGGDHPRCAPLAGKSTLNRLEQVHVEGSFEQRYVKFRVKPQEVEHLLVELFIELMQTCKQIILDMDVTLVHGTQEQAFFNGYYDHECCSSSVDTMCWQPNCEHRM